MRSPLPGHPKDDSADWRALLPHLVSFVEEGGSLILMFAESYGKTVGTLNELGTLFDIKFAFNQLIESNPERKSEVPNMPEGKLITCDIAGDNPFGIDFPALDLIVDGGHGAQHLTCETGPQWHPLIQGAESCASNPFPYGHYANSGDKVVRSPLLAAWREYGQGAVLAFPGASPFWLANACLRRWRGAILKQHGNAGYDFLTRIFSYKRTALKGRMTTAFEQRPLLKQQDYSYRYLNAGEWDEICSLQPFRAWLGLADSLDDAAKIKAQGYDAAILVFDYAQLTSDKWRELAEACAKLSEPGRFLALPAFEQADDEGNYCIVFNVDKLPDLRASYPNSNMLEDLLVKLNSYSAVFARQSESRIPPWRHGGYNLLEIASDDDLAVYRDRISSCTFLSAVQVDRGDAGYANWLLAPSLEKAPAAIRENRHFNFVSFGPVIKRFFWKSGPVMLDDWEGCWLEWETGDIAEIEISLTSGADISEVKLWDGEDVLKTWHPGGPEFSVDLSLELEYDLRLHLTAKDIDGGELIASYPLYTRNRHFWAHTGSDQMNDYHNVWTPDPGGSIGVGDRIYETCGFVTLGFGWGDYLRIAPPVNWGDIMPQGVEVSSMVGNLQSFHPSVFLATETGFEFLNNHHRKLGRCSQDLHIVHSESEGSWLEQPGAVWKDNIHPTRNFTISDLLRVEAEYLIPRWRAGCKCEVTVRMRLSWLKPYVFMPGQTVSLGHTLNLMKDNIEFCSGDRKIAMNDFLSPGIADQKIPRKEWDNSGLVELLKTGLDNAVEIPSGQAAGTVGDNMGDFLFKPVRVPGRMYMRGWRHNPGFVLSFELEPDNREIAPGTVMDIEYVIAVTPGEFAENKG